MAASRTIVLVGHCGPDRYMLKSVVSRAAPDAQIISINDSASLDGLPPSNALLLVNRVLEGDFVDDRGIELIRRRRQRPSPPMMMLISNHTDAQAEATAAGAMPGFGKSQLRQELAIQRLRDAFA